MFATVIKINELVEILLDPSGMRSNRTAFSLLTQRVLWCCYARQKNPLISKDHFLLYRSFIFRNGFSTYL